MDRDVRVQTTAHLGSFHMLAMSRSKSFKIGFNSTRTKNSQMDKLNLEKAEELEIQTANILWTTIEKAREFQNNIYICFIDYAKVFNCVDPTNCGKFSKKWEYQTTLPAS